MKRKQQRLEKVVLGVRARKSLQERRREGKMKRKEKIKESENESKKRFFVSSVGPSLLKRFSKPYSTHKLSSSSL